MESRENLSGPKSFLDKLDRYKTAAVQRDAEEYAGKIFSFAHRLQKKYPDYYKRHMYHYLIGSTPPDEATIGGDFSGEDSIEAFLKSLAEGG